MVTEAEDNPVELPESRIEQVWKILDKIEEKHFEIEEFTGDWSRILRLWYER